MLASPLTAASCPFSKRSTTADKLPSRRVTNVAPTSPSFIFHDPSSSLVVPTLPLVYLPPLLSLLPEEHDHPAPLPQSKFLFASSPSIGFTTSRLPSIDAASIALHRALHSFRPITAKYATVPYEDAFNFAELRLPEEIEREWYIVAFRSTRAAHSDSIDLYTADREAHEEAVKAGGLLMYYYGIPTSDGVNLATCIWQSRKHAQLSARGAGHVKAMMLAAEMYEKYELERYILRKAKGETTVSIENWIEGEVSF